MYERSLLYLNLNVGRFFSIHYFFFFLSEKLIKNGSKIKEKICENRKGTLM